jgi:hypothetical protein
MSTEATECAGTCSTEAQAVGDWLAGMIARAGGQRERDWANDVNHFARPFPDAPWVERHLPVESVILGVPRIFLRHQRTVHDFPVPDLAPKAQVRRLVSFDRPEQDRTTA